MNREIKFRAWDGRGMLSSNEVGDHTLNDLEELPFKLMQYTGLLDKNGKEIYEGDLIKWVQRMRPRIVVWAEGFYAAGIRAVDGETLVDDDFLSKLRHVEVIGNIYENPNLLADGH